jgi:hypothetical protein
MGWKQINGRSYFYRLVREGDRVRSEYVGAGETASLVALLVASERTEREVERQAWKTERGQADSEDRELAEWCDRIEALASTVMVAAGYHRHDRGEWRRKRRKRV